jgi:hypothetical protein
MTDEMRNPALAEPPPKGFRILAFAIKAAVATVVVLGAMLAVIAVSGADLAALDEHEVFRYRMLAAPVFIAGYLLVDHWLARLRAGAPAPSQARAPRGYAAEVIAVALVAGGGAVFWHDHMTHDIPNAVAVPATFVSATCVDRSKRTGPHMAIGYEFASRSTRVRTPQTKCLLADCGPAQAPPPPMDTEFKKVFYASLTQCQAALPAVRSAKAPATVWTGDKDPQAAVRARFTPQRENPPYFLLWLPAVIAGTILGVSVVQRTRRRVS